VADLVPKNLRAAPPRLFGWGLGASALLLIVLVWTVLTWGDVPENRIISPVTLPSPGEVVASVPNLLFERGLLDSILMSLFRVVMGFGLAVLIGVPLGMAAATWRVTQAFIAPLVLFGRNVPLAALIPLTLMWFGVGELQKIMFIFIACVPFITADSASAVLDIHERYVETAQTLGATSRQIFVKVLAPLALPGIFTGLRQLFGLAFGYIMLAEVIDAKHGLGHLIQISMRRSNFEHIYLLLIIIGILAYLLDRILAYFQRGMFPYREAE
jgi:NitT/TauT family transport system permease protein